MFGRHDLAVGALQYGSWRLAVAPRPPGLPLFAFGFEAFFLMSAARALRNQGYHAERPRAPVRVARADPRR